MGVIRLIESDERRGPAAANDDGLGVVLAESRQYLRRALEWAPPETAANRDRRTCLPSPNATFAAQSVAHRYRREPQPGRSVHQQKESTAGLQERSIRRRSLLPRGYVVHAFFRGSLDQP